MDGSTNKSLSIANPSESNLISTVLDPALLLDNMALLVTVIPQSAADEGLWM